MAGSRRMNHLKPWLRRWVVITGSRFWLWVWVVEVESDNFIRDEETRHHPCKC